MKYKFIGTEQDLLNLGFKRDLSFPSIFYRASTIDDTVIDIANLSDGVLYEETNDIQDLIEKGLVVENE